MASKNEKVVKSLKGLACFLQPLLPIANAHMVHFITDNYWNNLISEGVQNDLLNLCNEELAQLPEDFLHFSQGHCSHLGENLNEFLKQIDRHNKLFFDVIDDLQSIWEQLRMEPFLSTVQMNQFMKLKKTHEVGVLCEVISNLAEYSASKMIVDLGCGKGALGSMVSLNRGLFVWGIDAAGYDTHNEAQRQSRLEKTFIATARKTSSQDFEPQKTSLNFHRSVSFISEDTDLISLRQKCEVNVPVDDFNNVGITGLHTCGNLATTSLRLFIKSPHTKFICNVGCCYHLLDEYFELEDGASGTRGFPMSQTLLDTKFCLGRNARMMSAQPLERYAAEKKLQPDVLFYRALLQVILMEKLHPAGPKEQFHVGRRRRPPESFEEYTRWALNKLNINLEISSEELEDYEKRYEHYRRLMNSFFQLRLLIAPLVESLILLDRFAYLLEQESVTAAYLVRLFSPVTSPRCYGLIAFK